MRFLDAFTSRLKGMARFRPTRTTLRRLGFVAAFVACTAAAFWYGRQNAPQAGATVPTIDPTRKSVKGSEISADYARRIVAEIYGTPLTREDLGEYLIARFGAERLEFLVNRKIVEKECLEKGITVSDAEVEAQLDADITSMGALLTREEFVSQILKRFNKTLYEWKEDVIRPKLALAKLVRQSVTVEDAEIRKDYESKFGPRVEVRLIVFPAEERNLYKIYDEIKGSEEKFSHHARNNFIHHLAVKGGKVPPIHKHFPDATLERVAFSLKEGEVSEVVELKDKTKVVMKCDKILPADTTNTYESVRLKLAAQLKEAKVAMKIPEVFNELRRKADPKMYLRPGDAVATSMPRKDAEITIAPPK